MPGSITPPPFPSQLREAFLRPAVVVALVTTVFGSLSVSLASNYVTSRISERQQQLELIRTLMDYATDESLQDPTRLEAVLAIVRENPQFETKVDGYGQVVAKLTDDAILKERAAFDRMRSERDHLSTPFHKFVHVCLMRQSSVTSGGRVWRATGPSRAA